MLKQSFLRIEILLFKDIDFQMVYSKIRFFTSWMDSSVESRDTCFFVNYKRGLTLPKTELDSMSKRKLTTKFEEEPQKRVSIFHLLECISLIVRCIDWWEMRFLCHLSSTPIFHLPPAVLGDISVVTIWETNGYVQFPIRLSL